MDDMKKAARLKALEAVVRQMDEEEMAERLPKPEAVAVEVEAEGVPMEGEGGMEGGEVKLTPEVLEKLRALVSAAS